eukprot:TRINITY_DN71333_c0_g1_i1.p1 TRINITY_DN71333_c0_g1~~TRINITY_DN71333_c0_g1_i1.p1  ORF type:complete len:404 (+),score=19.30 TRINITY_DN71333_c0_g1_i1:59-1270(+)
MGASASRVAKSALHVPSSGCSLVAGTDPRIRFCGRVVTGAAARTVSFDWPCVRFTFSSTAQRLWLRMDGGGNFFNVLVDGHLSEVLQTKRGTRDYPLRDLPQSRCVVEVQKRTEPIIGTVAQALMRRETSTVNFFGVIVQGGDIGESPSPSTRRLEFVGDSETSGFGNLGPSQPGGPNLKAMLTVNPAHQDANQAWPAFVAKALGAEFHSISWSGCGVLWNAPGAGCSSKVSLHELYRRLLGSSGEPSSLMDETVLHSWVPDAVIVYAGGNDWWTLCETRDEQALVNGFREFLARVRRMRATSVVIVLVPSAATVCACIGSLEDQATFSNDMYNCWSRAISESGDMQVYLEVVDPKPPCSLTDCADWGQCGHWSVRGNQKWARAVAPLVAERLNWATDGSVAG